jgi:hypothetical protein
MAVMLRDVRIPSRVVTGFLGGAPNPLTGWFVVRGSDAHAWVEAWIKGQGWTLFDPTPPAADAAASGGLLTRIGLYMDAADTFWEEWVVGYDLDRQLTLAFRFDQRRRDSAPWLMRVRRHLLDLWRQSPPVRRDEASSIAALLLFAVCAFLARHRIRALASGWRRAEPQADRTTAVTEAARLYRRMLAELQRRGIAKAPFQTAREFAAEVKAPAAAALLDEFTESYCRVRYGSQSTFDPGAISRMTDLLQAFEALPRQLAK